MESVKEKLRHMLMKSTAPPSSNVPDCVGGKTEPPDDSTCAPEFSSSRNDSAPSSSASVGGTAPACESASKGAISAAVFKSERRGSEQGQVVMKGEDFWVEVDPSYESEEEPGVTFEVKFEPEGDRRQSKEQERPSASDEARALSEEHGRSASFAPSGLPNNGGAASAGRLMMGVPELTVCNGATSPGIPKIVSGNGVVNTLSSPVVLCAQPAGVSQAGGTSTLAPGPSMRNVAVLDASGLLQGVVPIAVNTGVLGQHIDPKGNLALIPRGDGTFNCLVIDGDRNPFIPEYESSRKVDKNYVCFECGQKFEQDNHLRQHGVAMHGSSKVYRCSDCGKKFGYRDTLKTHIATMHRGEGKFPCSACKKQFDREGHLLTHFATVHCGEKKFTCSECGKGFGLKSTLATHVTSVHRQEKRFSCPRCGKKFAQGCHLKVHFAGVHKDTTKFSCPECSRTFAFESYLKRHVAVVHKKEKNFLCSQCGRTFGEKGSLTSHVDYVHRGKQHACPDCDKVFPHRSLLEKHVTRSHGGKDEGLA